MSNDSANTPQYNDEPTDSVSRLSLGAYAAIVIVLLLAIIYALGQRVQNFRWHVFRDGLLTFGAVLLAVAAVATLLTMVTKAMSVFWPQAVTNKREKWMLLRAKRRAVTAIERKKQLNEERARLTARLQAAFLFEKESSKLANAKATREFREALQTSVLRSCEIAFEHITRVVSQYETVVAEIESSELCDAEKTQLLDSLAEQIDISAVSERNRGAQKMMEAEIWRIRFQKARRLAAKDAAAATKYLLQIQKEAKGPKLHQRIDDMLESLAEESKAE
jgi:hypothetical protein